MGVKYYSDACRNDIGLRRVTEDNTPPKTRLPQYEIIIIDEAQDIHITLFAFVVKILRDQLTKFNLAPKFLFIGDENQCVFAFKNSDSR